jgi:hypothetical protein
MAYQHAARWVTFGQQQEVHSVAASWVLQSFTQAPQPFLFALLGKSGHQRHTLSAESSAAGRSLRNA